MPYNKLATLPKEVQTALPHHAQEIYQAAFNNAWEEYHDKRETDDGRESIAHAVDWSAVKQKYYKDEQTGKWHKK
jgi:cation transport regulator